MELDITNVSITLSGKKIVSEVSAHVASGEFVGLLGPNGSGKSTYLKSIYKFLTPDSGQAKLDDFDIFTGSSKELATKMSVISQFQEFNFDFSVMQMVLMGRTPFKKLLEEDTEKDREIARNALKDVGLDGFESRDYSTLSGGEKQRVVLARAIAQTPGFMILDEPTNHLDIKYQLKILSVVQSMKIGVLAALHDLTLASLFCDRLYILKDGVVVASGTPSEVLTKETIKEVYEVDCEIIRDPVSGRLSITYFI
jgi:iron complex transport system ATP-binding protein